MMNKSYLMAVAAALTIPYVINLVTPGSMPSEAISAVAYIAIISIAAASFHRAVGVSGWGFRDRLMRAFSAMTIGLAFWVVAQVAEVVYSLVAGVERPYPSQIDVMWVLGEILIILGLWSYARSFEILWREMSEGLKRLTLLIALAIFFAVTAASLAIVNPFRLVGVDLLEAAMGIIYTILDSILLSLAILNLLLFQRGILGRVWGLISGGVAIGMLSDLSFLKGSIEGWHYSGHPVEILAIWGFTLVALGANLYAETFKLAGTTPRTS